MKWGSRQRGMEAGMRMTVYRPKIVEGRISGTGWPIDGHILLLSLWDHDDHQDWHLSGWTDGSDKAVMETMFITESAAGLCLYDTVGEFAEHWDGWEPEGSFCIPLGNVEVLRVIQEEQEEGDDAAYADTSESVQRHRGPGPCGRVGRDRDSGPVRMGGVPDESIGETLAGHPPVEGHKDIDRGELL